MKITNLKKKIIVNFSIAFLLLIIFYLIFSFFSNQESETQLRIERIKNETMQINSEISDLESKATEFKRYKENWEKLSAGKKNTNGVKIDDINNKLSAAKEKYSISDTNLKITLPEVLPDGIFKRDTLDVLFTTVNLTFSAVNDVKALLFINEFISSLQGYPIITNFEIKKNKDYSAQDLSDISLGKSGVVIGRIDFFWYIYKEKEATNPQASK